LNLTKNKPELIGPDREQLKNVIDIQDQYENESKRLENLNKDAHSNENQKPDFME